MADQTPTNPVPAQDNITQEPTAVAPVDELGEGGKAALESERKARREADKKLKALEAKVQEFEDANKTEAQKASERLAEAERRAIAAEARVLRRDVALEHKLSPEDASLLDTITDEDAMRKLAERLAGDADRNRKGALGPYVPQEGNVPNVPLNGDPLLDALRSKLGIA